MSAANQLVTLNPSDLSAYQVERMLAETTGTPAPVASDMIDLSEEQVAISDKGANFTDEGLKLRVVAMYQKSLLRDVQSAQLGRNALFLHGFNRNAEAVSRLSAEVARFNLVSSS